MHFYPRPKERVGVGMFEATTGRYVPLTGGSYSRLSIVDDPAIRRYWGFVGVDESKTADMKSVADLYKYLSGGVYIPEGPAGEFIKLILATTQNKEGNTPVASAE